MAKSLEEEIKDALLETWQYGFRKGWNAALEMAEMTGVDEMEPYK